MAHAKSRGFTFVKRDDFEDYGTHDKEIIERLAAIKAYSIEEAEDRLAAAVAESKEFLSNLYALEEGEWIVSQRFILLLVLLYLGRQSLTPSFFNKEGWSEEVGNRIFTAAGLRTGDKGDSRI